MVYMTTNLETHYPVLYMMSSIRAHQAISCSGVIIYIIYQSVKKVHFYYEIAKMLTHFTIKHTKVIVTVTITTGLLRSVQTALDTAKLLKMINMSHKILTSTYSELLSSVT